MRLTPSQSAPQLPMADIAGQPVRFGSGRKVMLSLFREASCPFCNFRVYELTHNAATFATLGIDVVAVFHSSPEEVRRFVARQPRPFRMVADPEGRAHQAFGVERSMRGKLLAMLKRMRALFIGLSEAGGRGGRTGTLMPADFLIDEHGQIVETYYGADAGDHIPLEQVTRFAERGTVWTAPDRAAELGSSAGRR